MQTLTVICPVHDEAATIPLFFDRLRAVFETLAGRYRTELVFVNNASTDQTLEAIAALRGAHDWVYVISLSSNVGYQRSVECGLRTAKGDLFVVIDVDCEDPPEMIPDFLATREQGYDIVYGERVDREEPALLKKARKMFYRFTRAIADEHIILDMAEFALITTEVRDAIIQDCNSFPFIRASIARIGYRRIGIPYKRQARVAGESHYNLARMTVFAVAGILSSTTLPLRLPIYLLPLWTAVILSLGYWHAKSGETWAFTSIMVLFALYVGTAVSFMAIYIARIYKNTLGRPNYYIDRRSSRLQP
ncbi:MAG TPA: glycosyltransferase family 2 protein [Burkholderiales bacterium]|nr:glycosyltransferase family 2 protein [Burkholderiales bacterium]